MFSKKFGYKQAEAVFSALRGKVTNEAEVALVVKTTLVAADVKMTYEREAQREIEFANTAIDQIEDSKAARVRELEEQIQSAREEIRELETEIGQSTVAIVTKKRNADGEIRGWNDKKQAVINVLNFFKK